MSYKLTTFTGTVSFRTKDDLISYLMGVYNGDGVNYIKVVYPDKSYFEYQGVDEE
tara:strand:- start:2941 stop:3105 length:165 start_codon:yes stop_codon:yes gene_type:complete